MRPLLRLSLAFFASLATSAPANALDTLTQGSVISGYATSQVTTGPFDHKLVLAAQDDAAAFVATDGLIRGVRLEAAIRYLRGSGYEPDAADLELAEAILVQYGLR